MLAVNRRSEIGLEAIDRGGLSTDRSDQRRVRQPNEPVQRARLARGARRFIVDVMRRRPTGIDVRGVPNAGAALADARDDERELRDHREDGRGSPEHRARGADEGGTHLE